jgi:DNA-binding NtrC family response regulator
MPTTVLLVDDEEMLRSLLFEALSLIDIGAVQSSSADEALALLEAPNDFALVITDICMPGTMDGLQLAQNIWVRWPGLPVILSSGNRSVSNESLPANACFLQKPWTLDQLHQVVRHYLGM